MLTIKKTNIFLRLLTLGFLLTAFALQAAEVPVFPEVETSDLNGKTYRLPHDFGPGKVWLIIAFEREQQRECDRVFGLFATLKDSQQHRLFELPVLNKLNVFMRWFIQQGMKSGISETNRRAQVLTLHVDLPTWKRTLQIPDNGVYLVRTDQKGNIDRMISTQKLQSAIDLEKITGLF